MKIISVFRASALSLCLAGCMSMDGGGSSPSVDIADGDAATARSQHGTAIGHYTRAIASGRLGAPEMLEAYVKRAPM